MNAPSQEPAYTVQVNNNTAESWHFGLFQRAAGQPANVISVVWISRMVNPGATAQFSWNRDFCFVWTNETVTGTSIRINDSQTTGAILLPASQIEFSNNGNYLFGAVSSGGPDDNLAIVQDGTIPAAGSALIGIGMGGNRTLAVLAQPNLTASFSVAGLSYHCFFAGSLQTGQAVSAEQAAGAVEISFAPGDLSAVVNLGADNILAVVPSASPLL